MNVKIKDFGIDLHVKNKGMEIAVADTSGKHVGDLFVTKTGLIWCKGKTDRSNGVSVKWPDFIAWIES